MLCDDFLAELSLVLRAMSSTACNACAELVHIGLQRLLDTASSSAEATAFGPWPLQRGAYSSSEFLHPHRPCKSSADEDACVDGGVSCGGGVGVGGGACCCCEASAAIGRYRDGVNPCSLAYVVTREGAQRFVHHVKSHGFRRATDGAINDYLIARGIFFGSRRVLVTSGSGFGSDIFS